MTKHTRNTINFLTIAKRRCFQFSFYVNIVIASKTAWFLRKKSKKLFRRIESLIRQIGSVWLQKRLIDSYQVTHAYQKEKKNTRSLTCPFQFLAQTDHTANSWLNWSVWFEINNIGWMRGDGEEGCGNGAYHGGEGNIRKPNAWTITPYRHVCHNFNHNLSVLTIFCKASFRIQALFKVFRIPNPNPPTSFGWQIFDHMRWHFLCSFVLFHMKFRHIIFSKWARNGGHLHGITMYVC